MYLTRVRPGRDRMVVWFATTCAISAYHHWNCEFELHSWRGVLDTTLCDKVCQWLTTGWWFSPGPPFSSTNKTDRHDINEILLKVALNNINQPVSYILFSLKCISYILFSLKCISYILFSLKCISYILVSLKCISYILVSLKCISYILVSLKCISYILVSLNMHCTIDRKTKSKKHKTSSWFKSTSYRNFNCTWYE
jgi:hypothetical protein